MGAWLFLAPSGKRCRRRRLFLQGPPPSADGVVEIAYGVASEHQGNGYATEAAQALVAYTFTFGEVRVVRAHTLPESGASKQVLAKCGFRHVGEVIDPEDGLVWRFEKHNAVGRGNQRVDSR